MCGYKLFKIGEPCIYKGILSLILFIIGSCATLSAQRLTVATNLVGYANFGTINGEIGLGISQHFSLYAQAKFNPFIYKEGSDAQFHNKQLSLSAGCRYWFWHTWAGWFLMGQAGYSKYNTGGILSDESLVGDAYGVTLGGGYALMLTKRLNIDFGLGIMGGITDYTRYSCPKCGKLEERDKRLFVAPNNILIQLSYMF